jgi:hypothetical protein
MSKMVEMGRDDAVELAYGILWHMNNDLRSNEGRKAADARMALANVMSKDQRGRGIQAARDWFQEHPLPQVMPTSPAWSTYEMMVAWGVDE